MILSCDISFVTERPVPTVNSTILQMMPKVSDRNWNSSNSVISIDKKVENSINSWVFARIESLSRLTDNWDGEDAVSPNEHVVGRAKGFANFCSARGQKIYNCSPGYEGEIMFELRNATYDKSIEVIFYPTKIVLVEFGPNNHARQLKIVENTDYKNSFIWLNSK